MTGGMLSGPVDRDSYAALFQALSQRQRNGVLSILTDFGHFGLFFQEGKIVLVEKENEQRSLGICRRLADGGLLAERVVQAVEKSRVSSRKLFELIVGKDYVSEDEYLLAERAYDCDLLYSLHSFREAIVDFKPRLVNIEHPGKTYLYPTQVLLDLIEIESDEPRFRKLFEDVSSQTKRVRRSGYLAGRPTAEELRLFSSLTAEMSIRELYRRSLLSRYDFMSSLLSLAEQQVISGVSEFDSSELDDMSIHLAKDEFDDGIDYIGQQIILRDTLAEAALDIEAEEDFSLRLSDEDVPSSASLSPRGERAVSPIDKEDFEHFPVDSDDYPFEDERSLLDSSRENSARLAELQVPIADESGDSTTSEIADKRLEVSSGMSERISGLNYFFSDINNRSSIISYLMLFFVIVVTLRGVALFKDWFSVLLDFTSK